MAWFYNKNDKKDLYFPYLSENPMRVGVDNTLKSTHWQKIKYNKEWRSRKKLTTKKKKKKSV